MEPGIYTGITAEDYHAGPGVSCSTLKRFAQAPALALVPQKESNALKKGTLRHATVFEPNEVDRLYVVTDLDRAGTNKWKEAEAAAAEAGKELVKRPEWDDAHRFAEGIRANALVRELLEPGDDVVIEQSSYWIDPETGILCRGRADMFRVEQQIVVDLKTTERASRREFSVNSARYKYHWQDEWYRTGTQIAGGWSPAAFIFIAAEKSAPYLSAVYEIDAASRARANASLRTHLDRYAECQRTGIWPGYPETLQTLELPFWAEEDGDGAL